jgi:hypothetical protein
VTRPEYYKVGGALAVLLLGWIFGKRPRPPAGTVELGTPTVSGSGADDFGGQDYGVTPVLAPAGARLADDPEMERLIRESNAAIAAADAAE